MTGNIIRVTLILMEMVMTMQMIGIKNFQRHKILQSSILHH